LPGPTWFREGIPSTSHLSPTISQHLQGKLGRRVRRDNAEATPFAPSSLPLLAHSPRGNSRARFRSLGVKARSLRALKRGSSAPQSPPRCRTSLATRGDFVGTQGRRAGRCSESRKSESQEISFVPSLKNSFISSRSIAKSSYSNFLCCGKVRHWVWCCKRF